MVSLPFQRGALVARLGELVMILDLHRHGARVSIIARRTGLDRKTVPKVIATGLEPPSYGPRQPKITQLQPFERYLRERLDVVPELTAAACTANSPRWATMGVYTAVTDLLREIRPIMPPSFRVRFETPPGRQAQVEFALFRTLFSDEPGVERVVWLFSLVLGHSRMLWGRFVAQQDMQTVLRCHAAAFEALGGAPAEILYDRMKTVVDREAPQDGPEGGHIVYNRTLVEFARHYGYLPKACSPWLIHRAGLRESLQQSLQEFIRFLNAIENQVPANKPVHVMLDNYATHKHPKVIECLVRHERFTFHFTPTSASWTNAVEGFFAKLTNQGLKRGVFHSIAALQAAINRFVKEANQNPEPFAGLKNPDGIIAAVRRGHQGLDSHRQHISATRIGRLASSAIGRLDKRLQNSTPIGNQTPNAPRYCTNLHKTTSIT